MKFKFTTFVLAFAMLLRKNFKYREVSAMLTLALTCSVMLTSCGGGANNNVETPVGLNQTEAGTELIDEMEGIAPYVLTFTSNGDGTCSVTGLDINPAYTREFVMEIPERSPAGDTVISVAWETIEIDDVIPYYLTTDTDAKITEAIQRCTESGDFADVMRLLRVKSIYEPVIWEMITVEELKRQTLENFPMIKYTDFYVLDSGLSENEISNAEDALKKCAPEIYTPSFAADEYRKLTAILREQGVSVEEISSFFAEGKVHGIHKYAFNIAAISLPDTIMALEDGCLAYCNVIVGENMNAEILLALDDMKGARIYSKSPLPPVDFESGVYKNSVSFYWYSETEPSDGSALTWHFETDIYGKRFPKMW